MLVVDRLGIIFLGHRLNAGSLTASWLLGMITQV